MNPSTGAQLLAGDTPTQPTAQIQSAAPAAPLSIVPTGQTPSPDPASGAPTEWYAGLEDETMRGWVANKGWKDPLEAVKSGYNMEKLIGFDKAGRTIVLPKDDASPEEMRAFYTKMGTPEKASDYKLPIPEGMPTEFAKEAANWFHEQGVNQKQAEGITNKWNEFMAGQERAKTEAMLKTQSEELSATQSEWGAAADQNMEFAKRGAMQFIPASSKEERIEKMSKIEAAIGTSAMMKMFASIGQGIGEHSVHTPDGGSNQGAMTPAQAKSRIQVLKSDKDWTAKYLTGDKAAAAEMERLSKFAVGVSG